MTNPYFLFILLSLCSIIGAQAGDNNNSQTPKLSYSIIETQTHNPNSFIQGWVKDGDTFFESSGHYGRSFIQRYNHQSTTTAHLPKKYFAEGLTLLKQTLYMLTWKENTLLLLDKKSLQIIKRLPYKGEGWGLTHNGHELIMSNGSSTLLFRDPDTFAILRRLTLKRRLELNELEYNNGIIWANNWNEDTLYAINSLNGCLMGTMDLSPLRTHIKQASKAGVLNGIAYDKSRNALWITGKYWPLRFLISLPNITFQADKSC